MRDYIGEGGIGSNKKESLSVSRIDYMHNGGKWKNDAKSSIKRAVEAFYVIKVQDQNIIIIILYFITS